MPKEISKYKKSIMETYLKLLQSKSSDLTIEKLFQFPDDPGGKASQNKPKNRGGGTSSKKVKGKRKEARC